jgi:chromosome segregation ATPase
LRPMRIQRSLNELGDRLARARDELRIVDEQLLFQKDVVEEAKTRMLVSETPLADRVYREARDDQRKLEFQQEKAQKEIETLRREQDRLLDQMLGADK